MTRPVSHRANAAAIIFAIVFPSIITWAYFVLMAGQTAGLTQTTYLAGKVIQFGFPAVWVFLVLREKLHWSRPNRSGLLLGGGFGVLVAVAMVGLALLVLKPMGFFDGPDEAIRSKIRDMGLDSFPRYIAASVFYAFCHSLMEEYYWRWFVFKRLRAFTPLGLAILISSLGFMAHHVIVLGIYFGWASPATYLFSAAVAIGGAVWAWIYEKSGSLYGAWLSHLLVDAAIFTVGFNLAGDLLGS